MALPGSYFAQAGQQPQAVARITAELQCVLQGGVPGLQLPAVGLGQAQAATGQCLPPQALQGCAFLACGLVVCLHQKNGTAPGVGHRVVRVPLQRTGKVL